MRARHYLDVVAGTVVAKRAVGPNEDGSYPTPNPSWVLVSLVTYRRVKVGWLQQPDGTYAPPPTSPVAGRPDTAEEALARKEAALRAALASVQASVASLDARVTALEQATLPRL